MILTINKDGFLKIEDFKYFVDISKVMFYSFTEKSDGSLLLKFYDKNRKLIKLNKECQNEVPKSKASKKASKSKD